MEPLRTFHQKSFDENLLAVYSFKSKIIADLKNESPFIHYYENKLLKKIWTYKEIATATCSLAYELKNHSNLKANDRIGIKFSNTIEIIIFTLAAQLLNLTIVPLNPNETSNDLENLKNQFQLKYVFDSMNLSPTFPGTDFLNEMMTENNECEFSLFFSSGTTGKNKGVVHHKRSIIANLHATIDAHHITHETVLYNCLPLYHVNAFNFAFLAIWFKSAKLVHQQSFFLPSFYELINSEKINILNLVPPLIRLLNLDPRKHPLPNHVWYAVSAASFLSLEDAKHFFESFHCPIVQSYGLSETVNFSTIGPTNFNQINYSEYLNLDTDRLSIGKATWGNDLFILNPNEFGIGEIAVRGWNVFKGYDQNPSLTQTVFENSYFHTGDLGYTRKFHGEDYFFLTGRIKEIVKLNGFLYHLIDFDMCLMNDHRVNNCIFASYTEDSEEKIGVMIDGNLSIPEVEKIFSSAFHHKIKVSKIIYSKQLPISNTGKKRRQDVAAALIAFPNP